MLLGTGATEIELSGPVNINGDLTLANGIMISLASTSLTSISGEFAINNASYLSTVSFGSLKNVGSLQLQTLPALSELEFGDGITSADNVLIEDTFLGSLAGLALTQVNDLIINQNRRLVTADLPLTNVTGGLAFTDNGQTFSINLPNLTTVSNLVVSNVTQIKLPALQTIEKSALFDTNYFSAVSAEVLQTCSGGLSIVNNPLLEQILVPQLGSVTGSLLITNNSEMRALGDFSNLKTIDDDMELRGNFT